MRKDERAESPPQAPNLLRKVICINIVWEYLLFLVADGLQLRGRLTDGLSTLVFVSKLLRVFAFEIELHG
ncbi:hypothetical protein PUN28_013439 [Cardiocondyla obscurior]|uniref:Maturase K n=1 Tax=Cardiocondyla obscurior TaxID=286306 RepID=A0AAW2F566_9HYME